MSGKTSINTNVKDTPDIQRALETIKIELDKLKEKLEVTPEGVEDETVGQVGSIRIIKNTNNESFFEIKSEDGWKKPMLGETQITLKKLTSNIKSLEKKSIDELETEDSDTDSDTAKKTIYDEKAGKFVLPRPDYDSGWFDVDRDDAAKRQYTLTHNLNLTDDMPTHWVIYFRDVQSSTEFPNGVYRVPDWGAHSSSWAGISVCFINQKIEVSCGNSSYYVFYTAQKDGDGISHQHVTRGDARILVWK